MRRVVGLQVGQRVTGSVQAVWMWVGVLLLCVLAVVRPVLIVRGGCNAPTLYVCVCVYVRTLLL